MEYLAMILIIYTFFKSIYYGIYEINNKKNKSGGITVILIAILGLILPISLLIIY